MSTQVLEQRNAFSFEDLLAAEGNVWASMDSSYDRGLRAGEAKALRDHLGVIVATAQTRIHQRPQDRDAVLSFVAQLRKVLVEAREDDPSPFDFDGGLGI